MSIVVLISGKAAPGVTTTTAALAAAWPRPVLLVDADPAGGDLLSGWLAEGWVTGSLRREPGLVGFATATRHLPPESVPSEALACCVFPIPGVWQVRLLPGLADEAEAGGLESDGWRRLATALRDLTRGGGPDVLIDAGRFSAHTPWPLLLGADRVLLCSRASLRHLTAAARLRGELDEVLTQGLRQVGLAACAATARETAEIRQVLKLPIELHLPPDAATAAYFSDGCPPPRHRSLRRSRLGRAAALAARQLHTRLPTDSSLQAVISPEGAHLR